MTINSNTIGTGIDLDEKVKISPNDTNADVLLSKLAPGNNVNLTIINPGSNEQLEITSTDTNTDENVLISNTDTTPGNILSKIVPGSNITLTVLNPGSNEQLEIESQSSSLNQNAISSIITDSGTLTANVESTTINLTGSNGIQVSASNLDIVIDGSSINGSYGGHPQIWTANIIANNGDIRDNNGVIEWNKNSRSGYLLPTLNVGDRFVIQNETLSNESLIIEITGSVSFADPIYSANGSISGSITLESNVRTIIESIGDKGDPGNDGSPGNVTLFRSDSIAPPTGNVNLLWIIEDLAKTAYWDPTANNGNGLWIDNTGDGINGSIQPQVPQIATLATGGTLVPLDYSVPMRTSFTLAVDTAYRIDLSKTNLFLDRYVGHIGLFANDSVDVVSSMISVSAQFNNSNNVLPTGTMWKVFSLVENATGSLSLLMNWSSNPPIDDNNGTPGSVNIAFDDLTQELHINNRYSIPIRITFDLTLTYIS